MVHCNCNCYDLHFTAREYSVDPKAKKQNKDNFNKIIKKTLIRCNQIETSYLDPPSKFCLFLRFWTNYFTEKNIDFVSIRTQIVWVEGDHADH